MTDVKFLLIAALLLEQQPVAERDVQRVAMAGWTEARALAPKGGAVDLLGPVNTRLRELDAMPNTTARYAEVAIRAAVSAAQEERDEMGLFLEHARDLSKQMALAGAAPQWPLPIDELEGELWFEVDRFPEAREAYQRATKSTGSPNAWIGLARVSDRLGDSHRCLRSLHTRPRDARTANVGRARDVAVPPEVPSLKPEVLEALATHGLRPNSDTPAALLREQISDLYRIEIRKLRDRCRAGEFPTTELATHVVELRKRYLLLSIPVERWATD